MPTFQVLLWLFVTILVFGVARAAWRRRLRLLLHAVVFAGPAAAAWPWWFWYESTMPAGPNIRIDLPLILLLMAAVSVPAVLYLLAVALEVATFGAIDVVGYSQGKRQKPGPLRTWQNPSNPRGAAGRG